MAKFRGLILKVMEAKDYIAPIVHVYEIKIKKSFLSADGYNSTPDDEGDNQLGTI